MLPRATLRAFVFHFLFVMSKTCFMSEVLARCQSGEVERVEQIPCNLRNATAVQSTTSQLYHNIHFKTYGYICSNCFGIIAPLAPPLPTNRGGKRVTEACSTATLPSFLRWGARPHERHLYSGFNFKLNRAAALAQWR